MPEKENLKRRTISLHISLNKQAEDYAKENYGGNFSAFVADAIREKLSKKPELVI